MSKFSSLWGWLTLSLLYSPQKNEFLNRKESDLLFWGGFLNRPIMLTRSGVVWPSRSIFGTINSSMSTETKNKISRTTIDYNRYSHTDLCRHTRSPPCWSTHSLWGGPGRRSPRWPPRRGAEGQGPVHNPDGDPVLRVSLLQLTWNREWSVITRRSI